MSKPLLESQFKKKVLTILKDIPGMFVFTKEALALRGYPDLIGCYRGKFFGWELKRSAAEASKKSGRIVLQKYILEQIQDADGIGELVYPENFEEKLQELLGNSEFETHIL